MGFKSMCFQSTNFIFGFKKKYRSDFARTSIHVYFNLYFFAEESLLKNFGFKCKCGRCKAPEVYHNSNLEENLTTQIIQNEKHKNLAEYAEKLYLAPESQKTGKYVGWRFLKRCFQKFENDYKATDPDCIWWLAGLTDKAFAVVTKKHICFCLL